MGYDAPYKGLKVVDLSQGVAGPYTGMLMAQYGADVIKVEPHEGDWGRRISRSYEGHSAYSVPANLGKRSIAVDMKMQDGKDIVYRLLQEADLFIEGFRPGVAARLGVSYEMVSEINPEILYLSISGFGQDGPMRDRPAMDPVLQAFTGLMSVNKGPTGVPQRFGVIVCDMATALYAFQAVAVSLYARRDAREGRYIQANLMQAAGCFQSIRMLLNYMEGGKMVPGRVPSAIFPTRDGWVLILVFKEDEFPAFCGIIGKPDLANDPRFADNASRIANEADLMPLLNEACGKIDSETLCAGLAEARIMHEKVNEFADFLKHPQVEATGVISWLDHPGMGRIPMPNVPGLQVLADGAPLALAPGIGQHTREILSAHGYAGSEIAAFADRGVIAG